MKCPKCGFTPSRPATRCVRCGTSYPEPQQLSIEPEPVLQAAATAVPDWRKEVTRKAREYGERKKILTTPPRPLKEQESEPAVQQQRTVPRFERIAPRVEPVLPRVEPIVPRVEVSAAIEPEPQITTEVLPPPIKTSPPPLIREQQPIRRIELDLEEVLPLQVELESETSEEHPLYIGRRFAALLSDHVIMIGLVFAVWFFSRVVFGYDLKVKFESSALPIIGALLVFHFLYYFYFHKTSRQTPGQVFLSLEIRNPSTNSIPARKVIGRWASLVFLNVFNLLPVFLGKKFLLLDLLSGTEVRSFKDFNHEGAKI
jgi:uncharacterized RDD family membrane protein YckC